MLKGLHTALVGMLTPRYKKKLVELHGKIYIVDFTTGTKTEVKDA